MKEREGDIEIKGAIGGRQAGREGEMVGEG